METTKSEKLAIPEEAQSNAESETGNTQNKEVEDFNAPNDFKSIADYKRFSKATWGEVTSGKNPKLNMIFVK